MGSGIGDAVLVNGPVAMGPTRSQRDARALGEKSLRLYAVGCAELLKVDVV